MNHLWQSTMFAAVAGLMTLVFRSNRAAVRYWLWFAASCKFLVPFALLMRLGRLVPAPSANAIAPIGVPVAVEFVAQPFPETPAFVPASRRSISWLPIMWACGFAVVVCFRFRGWLRVRAAVHASTPIGIPSPVAVQCSPGMIEPGVVGWWRPTLLLPAGIFERLTATQLEAVLAHELCHVRRRDNLLAAIHMVVEALFWFHPLVWWIGGRLVEERERACDEEVLRLGSAPHDYAEAILTVCKLYVESPLTCVSGVTGADIKRRIEAIMTDRIVQRLNFAKKLVLATAGLAVLTAPIAIGVLHVPYLRAQSTGSKFEVASITLCPPRESGGRSGGDGKSGAKRAVPSPDRLDVACASVANLIEHAYGDGGALATISGGPGWINSERYRIDAKADGPQSRDTMAGPMMQALLEDRFRLKLRRESKDVPVYAMTLAKGGLKLQPSAEGSCETDASKILAAREEGRRPPMRCGSIFFGRKKDAPGIVTANALGMTLATLAQNLSQVMDRPVIDKTGLGGTFNLRVEFLPDDATIGLLARAVLAAPDGITPEPGPSIITALQTQVGLRLEPAKGPREFFIVDHIERPSEN
jgi:uncharacterized protein (TIGR03435 family)